MSLQQVSTLKGPSSESTTDPFQQEVQQNESSDIKIQLSVQCVVLYAIAILLTWLLRKTLHPAY